MSAPAESATPAAFNMVTCASPMMVHNPAVAGSTESFTSHKLVANLLRLYHTVELHSVTLQVFQVRTEPNADDYVPRLFSFGVVPRDITHTAANSSVVGYIPHLETFITSANGNEKTVSWGQLLGARPFPPGLQLDLSAAEIKSKFPEVLLGIHEDPDRDEQSLVAMRMTFVLRCSGAGFGAVY